MTTTQDPLVVQPRKQSLTGAILLIVGCAVAAAIIEAGGNVLAGVGFVIAVWGLALIVNGLVMSRREKDHAAQQQDGPRDQVAMVAVVLALVVPPVGLLLAAYRPNLGRPGQQLYAPAIAIGAILTVLYTFLVLLGAASARGDG